MPTGHGADVITTHQTAALPKPLDGSVAVVTGGGQGVGLGISECLLEAGATVVIAQRSRDRIDEAVAALGHLGTVVGKSCDVSRRGDVEELFAWVTAEFGPVDVLAANAALTLGAHFLDITDQDWDATMAVNLKGMFLCGQVAARQMVDKGIRGRIVLTSSVCATAAEPECAHYNASKGGVSALCKSMAIDLARFGIVTNAVAPGWILTPVTEPMLTPAQLDGGETFPLNPMGRIGLPRDVGRVVAWLADPNNTYMSGAVVTVDGAQTSALGSLDP